MDHKVWMYLVYLAISVGLTVWVATTLSRNGLVFLSDVFADAKLARAVNHLLVMGFYLLNLGYVGVAMRSGEGIPTASRALETLSMKVGFVLLVLGGLHFCNVFFLDRYRRGRLRQQQAQPPLPPVGHLPRHPQGPVGGHGPVDQPGAGATGPWPSHPTVPGTPRPPGTTPAPRPGTGNPPPAPA
ncbi:MAG TPA: hypothetical protein VFR35_18775 [Actinoplanes sp.]|nr:hypothetical protein [Actinoplanes sp.]